jgi:type VI secretion system secreted protein Hcp
MHAHGGGAGAGKVTMHEFHFVMSQDKATPKLMLACCQGDPLRKVTIGLSPSGGERKKKYMQYTLDTVYISSWYPGKGMDTFPVESMSLNYTKIYYDYQPQGSGPDKPRKHRPFYIIDRSR